MQALDVKARDITPGMKLAAAEAIASVVSDDELGEDYMRGRKVRGEWVEEHTRKLEFYSTFVEPLNEKRKAFSGRGSSP